MIEKALRRLAGLSRRHYRAIFLLTALLSAVAVGQASRLRFDTEILNLLPPDDPAVRTFLAAIEEFGNLEILLVVVRIPDGEVVDPYLDVVDALGPRLKQLDEVEAVEYSLGGIEEVVEQLLPRAFLLLDGAQREKALERLTDEGIRSQVAELRRRVATPQALLARSLLQLDPLGISELLLDEASRGVSPMRIDWARGYLLSEDHRMALLVVRPVRPAMEAEFARRLLAGVEQETAAVLDDWEEIAGPRPPPRPRVEVGGSYATVVEDARHMRRDVVLNVLTAMVGVLVLFVLAFRRVSLVGYAFVPLLVGLLLGFGFAGAVFGTLSAASSGFAALLLGLALDFVIVSYGRYVEERQAGADLAHALAAMAGTSGRAVVTGAVTTAATFYAFAITEFAGLRQMGLLTGTGILLCMAAVLVLLPAMLAWSEDRHQRRVARTRTHALHAFGLGGLVSWSFRRPVAALATTVLLSLVAAVLAPGLRFDDDIRRLRPADSRGVAIQNEVAETFGSGFDSMMLLVDGEQEEEVLELVYRTEAAAAELVEQGVLVGTDSIASMIPSAEEQTRSIEWLERHRALLDGDRLWRVFAQAASREGLRPEAFAHGIELLARAGAVRRPLRVADLATNEQSAELLARYVRHDGEEVRAVVYLLAPPRVWALAAPPEARALAEALGPHVTLTGANLIGERLRGQIRADAATACLVGFLLVTVLLYVEYRSVADTLLSLLPLSVGMLWMIAGMVALGLQLNFFNIFVTTMIIGIGVDYGIHMVNRYREHATDRPPELESSLRETGRAVVLAALSTVVGFGSLSLSSYPGIRSIGLVSILGALATALVAITALPALFSLASRKRR